MIKIAVIGAGSVVFAKTLISDLLQFPALSDCTISLMDIDGRRLATIEQLARRMIAQLGVSARIEATLDLREACRGARFAITTVQVGGYRPSTVVDFEIPARYGLAQTIGDTLGVGGVFRALRTIPVLTEVARALEQVGAPDALLLNYTNPMAMNMWAIHRLTAFPAVGLCHSIQSSAEQISSYCGWKSEEIDYLVAGINHMAFFLRFEHRGKDAYPFLFRAAQDPAIYSCDRVRFEMMQRLGYFVTESSEHHAEYVPYFIHHGKEIVEKFRVPINEYLRRCESQIESWDRTEADLLDPSRKLDTTRSVEYGPVIINSLVSGHPSVVYGNVPNTRLIENLREGCCVEVPCLVDRLGLQPTHIGNLPPQLSALISTNINVQELTVEAAVTRRREFIYHAVMMDPHTASSLPLDKIWKMCDDLIDAHQRDGYLGSFHPVIHGTGRPLADAQRVFLSVVPLSPPPVGEVGSTEFALVAENTTDADFAGPVGLAVSNSDYSIEPRPDFEIQVPRGQKKQWPFTLHQHRATPDGVTISIASESRITLERDFHLPRRQRLALPVSPTGQARMDLEVLWSGNQVARGQAWLQGSELVLELRVHDTHIHTVPDFYWDGSAVELGLKDSLASTTACQHILVLPGAAHAEVLVNNQPSPAVAARVHLGRSGYDLAIRLDCPLLGIDPARPFLWDLVFHINALGSAHGKIRQSWQGSANLITDQSHFALAIPTLAG